MLSLMFFIAVRSSLNDASSNLPLFFLLIYSHRITQMLRGEGIIHE